MEAKNHGFLKFFQTRVLLSAKTYAIINFVLWDFSSVG